jgi:hypothetical protein
LNRSAKFAFRNFPGKRFRLIDQYDRHTVAVAGGQIGLFVNIHAGEGKGDLGLHVPGHALDDVAEVAVVPGKDRHFNHGCTPRRSPAGRQESVDLI